MKKLTSQGFAYIRNRMPRLEMLGLDGCDNVSMGEILFILDTVAPFPALRRLHAARLAPSKRPYPGPWNEALQAGLAVDSCTWMALTDVCLAGQCNGAWTLDRHKNPYWQGALATHGDEAAAASIVCFERGAAAGDGGAASPARWRFKVGLAHVNGYGALHGGAISTIVDVVGTLALLSKDPSRAGVSIEMNQSFCAAAFLGLLCSAANRRSNSRRSAIVQ